MAAFMKTMQVSKILINVTKLFSNMSLSSNITLNCGPTFIYRCRIPSYHTALLHTTSSRNGLMEFFDDEKNWGEEAIKVGRSWRTDELRLKSNEDLHKLWFVLLKERNMLLTMEEACKQEDRVFANPERFDKVEESMENLETVVRERNKAYHLLETGKDGERPGKLQYNALGMRFFYRMRQYSVPKFMNTKWHKTHMFHYNLDEIREFRLKYNEKIGNRRRRGIGQDKNRVARIFSRFPNVDVEAVKQQYPNVDVDSSRKNRKARTHLQPQ